MVFGKNDLNIFVPVHVTCITCTGICVIFFIKVLNYWWKLFYYYYDIIGNFMIFYWHWMIFDWHLIVTVILKFVLIWLYHVYCIDGYVLQEHRVKHFLTSITWWYFDLLIFCKDIWSLIVLKSIKKFVIIH